MSRTGWIAGGTVVAVVTVGVAAVAAVVVLGSVLVGGIFLVIALAGGDEVSTPGSGAINSGSGGRAHPVEITPGQAFELSGIGYAGDWRVRSTPDDGWELVGLRATRDQAATAGRGQVYVEVALWHGPSFLSRTTCFTSPLAAGQSDRLSCSSWERLPAGFDRITLNDQRP